MSLTKAVLELYESGQIREDVMEHAVKEASAVKEKTDLIRRIKVANARKDILGATSKTLDKVAGFSDIGPLGRGALALAGVGGLAAVSDMARSYGRSVKHESSYKTMMERNPLMQNDAENAKRHFDIMAKFAPDLAADPTIAAGHVTQVMEMGNMIPADTIKNLATAQKTYNESNKAEGTVHQILQGLSSGLGSLALSSVTGES